MGWGHGAKGTPPFFCMVPTVPPFFSCGANSTPFFWWMLPFYQTIIAFERQVSQDETLYKCHLLRSAKISKMGRYTNGVCCEVKILH